jgi:uncharacterized membrane protein YphA (DoxX/SURF4 family)
MGWAMYAFSKAGCPPGSTVLVAAAWPKLADAAAFAEAVANYRLLPQELIGPVALVVPIVELVLVAALLTGVAARGAGLATAALMTVFAVAIAQAQLRGIDLQCGCFGGDDAAQAGWPSVARNAGLTLAGLFIATAPRAGWPLVRSRPSRRPADTGTSG